MIQPVAIYCNCCGVFVTWQLSSSQTHHKDFICHDCFDTFLLIGCVENVARFRELREMTSTAHYANYSKAQQRIWRIREWLHHFKMLRSQKEKA